MKRLLLVVVATYISLMSLAQKTRITGTVINKTTQQPLVGATVSTKERSVKTDDNGKFAIDVSPGQELKVTYVGMRPFSIKLKNEANVSIEMEEGASELDQVVVVGYNTQRKIDLTGAVSVVRQKM